MIDDKELDILLINLKELINNIEERDQKNILFSDLGYFYSVKDLNSAKIEYIISRYEKQYPYDKFLNLIIDIKKKLEIYVTFYENNHLILNEDNIFTIIRKRRRFFYEINESIQQKIIPIDKEISYQNNILDGLDKDKLYKINDEDFNNSHRIITKEITNLTNELKPLKEKLTNSNNTIEELEKKDTKYLVINFNKIYEEFKKAIILVDNKVSLKSGLNFNIFNMDQCSLFYKLTKDLYVDNTDEVEIAALLNKTPVRIIKVKSIEKFRIILRLYDELDQYNHQSKIGEYIVKYLKLNGKPYKNKKSQDIDRHPNFYKNALEKLERLGYRFKFRKLKE